MGNTAFLSNSLSWQSLVKLNEHDLENMMPKYVYASTILSIQIYTICCSFSNTSNLFYQYWFLISKFHGIMKLNLLTVAFLPHFHFQQLV